MIEDNLSGARRTIDARALFVFIGAVPSTDWLDGQLALDEDGFLVTGKDAGPESGPGETGAAGRRLLLETSWPGVFAAGDVRNGSPKRVASAVGEGAMAVRLAHERARVTAETEPARPVSVPVWPEESGVLQARLNLITADPLRLGNSVKFIENDVRPAVEDELGNLGMSLYTNPELGVAVLTSFWVSRRAAAQRGGGPAKALRGDQARRGDRLR